MSNQYGRIGHCPFLEPFLKIDTRTGTPVFHPSRIRTVLESNSEDWWVAQAPTRTCLSPYFGTLRNRIWSLDRRNAWGYTENRGGNHENRSDRRQWTDRVKARYQVARARARSSCRISQFRRQHTHVRGTGRSAEGCVGGR